MKRIFNVWTSAFMVLMLMFAIQSCDNDPCSDVTCFNGGVCVDGTCDCPAGFGGSDCATTLDQCVANGTVCLNGGTCDSATGDCDCPSGFSGDSCQVSERDFFLSTNNAPSNWDATDNCSSGNYSYTPEIRESNLGADQLSIDDFGGFSNFLVTVAVDGRNFAGIGNFTEGDVTISAITGSISADGNTITLSYTATDPTTTDPCTGTWTRQ